MSSRGLNPAGGQHRYTPAARVASVGGEVKRGREHERAMREWMSEPAAAM